MFQGKELQGTRFEVMVSDTSYLLQLSRTTTTTIRDFTSYDGDANETVTSKYNFTLSRVACG